VIATSINLGYDLIAFAVIIGAIQAGRLIGGAFGGLLVLVGLLALVVSGIDSAVKLFDTDWSFLERLYHLGWVIVGGVAVWVIVYGFRVARDRMRERDG